MAEQRVVSYPPWLGPNCKVTVKKSLKITLLSGGTITEELPDIVLENPAYAVQVVALTATTNNELTIPTLGTGVVANGYARRCTIIPPAGNTVAITLKAYSTDTGYILDPAQIHTLALYDTAPVIILYPASALKVTLIWS